MEERIVDLESRLAFQEHAIEELSNVIAHQQIRIDLLQQQLRDLTERMRAVAPSNIARPEEETRPPHY